MFGPRGESSTGYDLVASKIHATVFEDGSKFTRTLGREYRLGWRRFFYKKNGATTFCDKKGDFFFRQFFSKTWPRYPENLTGPLGAFLVTFFCLGQAIFLNYKISGRIFSIIFQLLGNKKQKTVKLIFFKISSVYSRPDPICFFLLLQCPFFFFSFRLPGRSIILLSDLNMVATTK